MTLTVLLGCRACYSQQTVEVPVQERWEGPDHWHLHLDTSLLCAWREAHRLPYAWSQQ